MLSSKFLFAFLLLCSVCPVAFATPITIMPLGDSTTEGFNNVSNLGGYRPILYNELASQGYNVQYQGVYDDGGSPALTAAGQGMQAGFSGFSTTDILNNLASNTHSINSANSNMGGYWLTGGNGTGRSALDPDIVILMGGANDWGYAPETENTIPKILSWFSTHRPNTEVIVASTPPPWGDSGVDLLASATEAETAFLKTYVPANYPQDRVADVVGAFLNPNGSVNQSLLDSGSVHPNQAGYLAIANVFDAAIEASVQSPALVPEPTGIALICVGGVLAMRRQRI